MASSNQSMVELPTTLKLYIDILKKNEDNISYNYPSDVKSICRYSGSALAANRSCGNVIIMMAGRTGAGKSTTINKLFDDNDLCKTSSSKSETESVWEINAPVIIEKHSPPMKTSLVFVDIPGALDVDLAKRELNEKIINMYLKTNPCLAPRPTRILDQLDGYAQQKRKGMRFKIFAKSKADKFAAVAGVGSKLGGSDSRSTCRSGSFQKVYPNLILLTVNATDNRMVGSGSDLHFTLDMLKDLQVVDIDRPNIIVVATNAASVARKYEKYVEKTNEIKNNIIKLLNEVFENLSVANIPVVFIENDPEGQELEKVDDSEFYALPDGTLSHFNLIQAMVELLKINGDLLGMMACGWYFGEKCFEQKVKVNVSEKNNCDKVSMTDDELAELAAREIDKMNLKLIRELPMMFIAHGFCPSTETRKCSNVLESSTKDKLKRIKLDDETFYTLPQFLHIYVEETFSLQISEETKEEYEQKISHAYGIDQEVMFKLSTSVSAIGKWARESADIESSGSTISYLYESRVLKLEIAKLHEKFNPELLNALKQLPNEFTDDTQRAFFDFFAEWGSHFVRESYFGGSIKLQYCKKSSTEDNTDAHSILEKKISDRFISLNERKRARESWSPEMPVDTDLDQISLKISGGTPPPVTKFSNLTRDMFVDWMNSIKKRPIELEHSIRLAPYYLLLPAGNQRASLQLATAFYITGRQPDMPLTRANVSNAICKGIMYDEIADDDDDNFSNASLFAIGAVALLSAPIWLPFYGVYKAFKGIKRLVKRKKDNDGGLKDD